MTVRKSLAQQEEYRVRDTEREPQTEAGRALYGFEPSAGMLRHVLAEWIVRIHADNVVIKARDLTLWEDLDRLRRALAAVDNPPAND